MEMRKGALPTSILGLVKERKGKMIVGNHGNGGGFLSNE